MLRHHELGWMFDLVQGPGVSNVVEGNVEGGHDLCDVAVECLIGTPSHKRFLLNKL